MAGPPMPGRAAQRLRRSRIWRRTRVRLSANRRRFGSDRAPGRTSTLAGILRASMTNPTASKPVRIVQYHPRALAGDGGVTNSVRRLSAAMAALGADLVVAYDGADGHAHEPTLAWAPVRHVGPPRIRLPLTLDGALQDADVLVCNSAWTAHNAAAGRAARRARVPYILAPRGAYDPRIRRRRRLVKDVWWRAFERRLVDGARAVHVFFPEERSHLEALGITRDLIIAPNGVSVPEGVTWDGGSGGYLLYLGRFDPEHKGLDLLVRAAASLPAGSIPLLRLHGPDWRGGKAAVRALIRELGATDRVVVGEPVYGDDKWELLRAAVGFVYPSRWEGFGNSTAEAAALGVPTLVTPYPLGVHLARNGAAVLVDVEPASLRNGLRQLSSPHAAEVGRRAAQVVAEELTWEAVAAAWLQQIATLIEPVSSRDGRTT